MLIRNGVVEDVSRSAATVADLMDLADPASVCRNRFCNRRICRLAPDRFLAPVDLQAVKAAGVTFAVSAIERVIEERARGDSGAAAKFATSSSSHRRRIRSVVPGAPRPRRGSRTR